MTKVGFCVVSGAVGRDENDGNADDGNDANNGNDENDGSDGNFRNVENDGNDDNDENDANDGNYENDAKGTVFPLNFHDIYHRPFSPLPPLPAVKQIDFEV